jgi:hypothetical protein
MKLIKVFLLAALLFTFFITSNAQNVSDKNYPGATLDDYLRRAAANGFSGAVLNTKDMEETLAEMKCFYPHIISNKLER